MVVQKLGSLVEESGVIFVSLDDEFFPPAEAVTPVAKIRRDAADQKIGPATGGLQDPRKHGRGGRLAVRPGNYDRGAAGKKIFLQQLRHRAVRNLVVENAFHFGIAARYRVADHRQIRHGRQIFLAVAFVPRNSQRGEQRRCRRIDIYV